ncbi:MAG: glycoside hydrolase family 16 protein [Bacteroidota bacterium]
MRLLILLLTLPLFACSSSEPNAEDDPSRPAFAEITTTGGEWTLAWNDEFDTPGLPNEALWNYENGKIRNNEAQFYTTSRRDNARVEDGDLIITARKESWLGQADYTSASVTTRNRNHMTYGRIEIRAQLPTGNGMWPALWMLGENIDEVGWPLCGEIDIMENVGFDPNTIHANIHTRAFNHVQGTNKGDKITISRPFGGYHVYAVEWFEDRIDFYVDDEPYFRFSKQADYGVEEWPFDAPHYLIMNIAVGGSWGGSQGIDDSIFPQEMRIDYVRVYDAAN